MEELRNWKATNHMKFYLLNIIYKGILYNYVATVGKYKNEVL